MPSKQDKIFITKSTADFGFVDVFLTHGGLDHINVGRRDRNLSPSQIKEAVERATHVVTGNQPNRVVFYSTHVLNVSGRRPLAVVVESSGRDQGKNITSTWKDNVKGGPVLWESTNGFYTDFDADSDIVYISKGPVADTYSIEDDADGDIWYNKSDDNDAPVGVTIFRARERERQNSGWIAGVASDFLGLTRQQISDRLDLVMPK